MILCEGLRLTSVRRNSGCFKLRTSCSNLSVELKLFRLAATVFGNRARKGRNCNSGGSERRCLPVSFVVKHGIENSEELAHTGDERGLGVLTIGTQPQIESSDGGIAADSSHR